MGIELLAGLGALYVVVGAFITLMGVAYIVALINEFNDKNKSIKYKIEVHREYIRVLRMFWVPLLWPLAVTIYFVIPGIVAVVKAARWRPPTGKGDK